MAVALVFAVVGSQFAVDNPDGLEKVAIETGIAESGEDHLLRSAIFADYATAGLENEAVSLAIAGLAGTVIVLAVGWGIFHAVRDKTSSGATAV